MACGGDDSKVEKIERTVINVILFLFSLVGLFLVVVGSVGMAQYGYLAEIVQKQAFALTIGAGVCILLTCLIGFMGARWVLAEDPANHGKGKILLAIFALILTFFIIFQLACGVLFLAYAGKIEKVETGNNVVDNVVADFNEQVDRIVNCTFNYCCDQRNLLRPVKYTTTNRDGSIGRPGGKGIDDPYGRSQAYSYLLGNVFVPMNIKAKWEENAATAGNTDSRTVFKEQFYNGTWNYDVVVNSDKDPSMNDQITGPSGPNTRREVTKEWIHRCNPYDSKSDLGRDCWVRWKAQCPDPLKGVTTAGWDQVCQQVGQGQTWIKPKVNTNGEVEGTADEATPMLDVAMCNALDGSGVTERHVGFKAAVIWKIQKARPLAIILVVLATLQLLLLVTSCFLLCHRANTHHSENTPWDASSGADVAPKVEEGEGKSQKDEGTNDDNDL